MSRDRVRIHLLNPGEMFETSLTERPGEVLKKITFGEIRAVDTLIDGKRKTLHPDVIVRLA